MNACCKVLKCFLFLFQKTLPSSFSFFFSHSCWTTLESTVVVLTADCLYPYFVQVSKESDAGVVASS